MKNFEVTIIETLEKTITVQAEDKEKAQLLAEEQWIGEKYILGADDFVGVQFRVSDECLHENELHVLLVEPKKRPKEITIGSDLEDLQEIIGGPIELAYYYPDPVAIICDEEGKIKGLPLNRSIRCENGEIKDIIAGTFLICGYGEANFKSLSSELVEKYKAKFEKPEEFFQLGGKIVIYPMEVEEGKSVAEKVMKSER